MARPNDINLPAIFQSISSNPEALEVVKRLNETICFGNSALSRVQEEAIATVIAVADKCRYNALTHGGFLRRHSGDPELASHLLYDYTRADLDPRNRQMLDFAVRLTREPGSFTAQDLEGLRRAGFDQEAIVSIVLITCLFNFMNRLATSFGVEVPPGYRKVVESWLSGPAAQAGWLLPPLESQSDELPADRLGSHVTRGQQTPAGQGPSSTDRRDPGAHDSQTEQESAGELENRGHREAADSLEGFISECCTVASSESTTARDLYISYLRWCDDKGEHALLQRNFGMQLTQLGYHRRRRSGGRHWWQGICLKDQQK